MIKLSLGEIAKALDEIKLPHFDLLVAIGSDTVARTGKTLEKAKEILGGNEIKTFVINGKADYSLFDYKECIEWPW